MRASTLTTRPLARPRVLLRRPPLPPPRATPLDPTAALATLEVSLAAHEDVILFLLGQDCDVALTRALAVDAFDAAAAARERRRRIDDALDELKAARVAAGEGEEGGEAAGAVDPGATDSVDAALRGVRLRSDLADAIAAEDYAAASTLRDALKELEAAAAAAAARDAVRAERTAPPALRLGQRVTHKEAGYRGVVCG